ncbi:MAG: class I SAM-dependent methyltransferase [Bacteroidetes bacterium]|nr:class I SAM-dependent methyltransferase [Bacteroidota bacterium]
MNTEEEFINVPLDKGHIHLYLVRNAIYNALKNDLAEMHGDLLDIGCGYSPYKKLFLSNPSLKKYTGLDLEDHRSYNNKPDLTWDGKKIPLADGSVHTVILTEVLEHSPAPIELLKEADRVLSAGGKIFITVPFFWMLHEVPYDEFRYTPFSLGRIVDEAGFSVLKMKALGGWNASLVQLFANWVYYSDEKLSKRQWALRLLWPFLKKLIRRDKIPVEFKSGQMITGIYCLAEKK